MFLIGIIISCLLMRFNKKTAYLVTIAATAYGILQIGQVYNGNLKLYISSTISAGLIMGFLGYFIITMFLLRVIKIKPKFKKFYIKKGVVVNKAETNYSGSNTTISRGTFGGLDASTQNYNYNVDTLFVKTETGNIVALNGIGRNRLAKVGQPIALAGFGSLPETLFLNTEDGNVYNSHIESAGAVLLGAILFSVPLIGHLILFGAWLKAFANNGGIVSERTNEYDCANLFFTFIYTTVMFFVVALQFRTNPDFGVLTKQYIWLTLPLLIVQYQIMRLDHIRFHKFLFQKLKENR